MPDHALLALQGPAARGGHRPPRTGAREAHVHERRGARHRRHRLLRDALGLHRRGRLRDLGRRAATPKRSRAPCSPSPRSQPAGLGARDTLRLEAGLCLYGHDIDTTTTPIEAGLTWAIQKVRRPGGERAGGYPGAATIERQLAHGADRKRVGLVGLERAPVREGAAIVDDAGVAIGRVTSGTIGPTVGKPIALAYVPTPLAAPGTRLDADVRGKRQPMQVVSLPFAPHRYFRG